jgi:hypothetical protein
LLPRFEALRPTIDWEQADPPSLGTIPSDEEMASRSFAEDAVLEV